MPTDKPSSLMPAGMAPAAAFALAAATELTGADGEELKPRPIRMLARTGQPIEHWWWGNVVHDMSGFTAHKPRIVCDYCHGEEIGYLDKFEVDEEHNLVVEGVLTPTDDPGDTVRKLFQRSDAGVPYEASIFFDPDELSFEEVPAGFEVEVNGYTFHGPGLVVRQWVLRGVSVCPHGYDRDTLSEFARRGGLSGSRSPQKGPPIAHPTSMSKSSDQPADDATADQTTATNDDQPSGDASDSADAPDGGVPDGDAGADTASGAAAAGAAELSAAQSLFGRYAAEFGDAMAAEYLKLGLSFEEATSRHIKFQSGRIGELEQKLSGATAAAAAGEGEDDPVGFSASDAPGNSPKKARFARLASKR